MGPQGIQGPPGEQGPAGNNGANGECSCPDTGSPTRSPDGAMTPTASPDDEDSPTGSPVPPLTPACDSGVIAAEAVPCTVSSVASSCKEHYDLGRTSDGMYCVDPGDAGAAFEVWCDQTSVVSYDGKTLTGGWALFCLSRYGHCLPYG